MFRALEAGYKLCPRCRRAAPLAAARCGRCGHDYPGQLAPPGQTLVFRRCPALIGASPAASPRSWPVDGSLIACVGLLIALFGLLFWRSVPHSPALARFHRVILAHAGPPVNL